MQINAKGAFGITLNEIKLTQSTHSLTGCYAGLQEWDDVTTHQQRQGHLGIPKGTPYFCFAPVHPRSEITRVEMEGETC